MPEGDVAFMRHCAARCLRRDSVAYEKFSTVLRTRAESVGLEPQEYGTAVAIGKRSWRRQTRKTTERCKVRLPTSIATFSRSAPMSAISSAAGNTARIWKTG